MGILEGIAELPRIVTRPPGPMSRELARRLTAVECRSITYQDSDLPIFWARASGVMVEDVDGNRYLDVTSAFAVASCGHSHPRVVEAVQAQASQLMHGMGDVHPAEAKVRLLEKLAQVAPGELAHTILGSSGSDAVEAARKVCALHTGRPRLLAFEGAYHGLSYGALEATARADFREPFAAQLRGAVTHVPFPDPYRGLGGERPGGDLLEAALAAVERALDDPARGAGVGGILVEPIQGRGGTIIPPEGFLAGLRRICDERGLLLIADEIYTGFGRTGRLFACDHEGVVPDLLCLGKGMTGGMPVSACIGPPRVMDSLGPSQGEAIHTQTFLGHPLGAAAATAAIDVILDEGLSARAARLGEHLLGRLEELARRHPVVGHVRGRGLSAAVELVRDRRTREPAAGLGATVMKRALAEGLLLLPSGPHGSVIGLSPPLIIEASQLDLAVDVLDRILAGL